MSKKTTVEKYTNKIKKAINAELNAGNFDEALMLISICSGLLYHTNIKYVDEDLENALARVGKSANLDLLDNNPVDSDLIMVWDGFGLNDRGLIQIYLKALCQIKKVLYITYDDCKNQIPDVQRILDRANAYRRYIVKDSPLAMINQLNGFIKEFKPAQVFIYTIPDDVVAIPVMYAYEGIIRRYLINLTDHAFWLGAGCCDMCINFREYGAKISNEYRNIQKGRNIIIPFYPIIDYGKEFQGFPFNKSNRQKVIFSGGALYKTLGEGNQYYEIVDHILGKHKEAIFWYAGDGDDTELKKIQKKYKKRVFHTAERTDLYQTLEHCSVYLSTFPMCGGLMFQYAAMAGRVPVTLKYGSISDGFLIEQNRINIEFYNKNELYKEIDLLLTDEEYSVRRGELMKKSVITPESFNEEVKKLVTGEKSEHYKICYEHIDTTAFRNWYLEQLSYGDIAAMTIRRTSFYTAIKHYPFVLLVGGFFLVKKKFNKNLSKRKGS